MKFDKSEIFVIIPLIERGIILELLASYIIPLDTRTKKNHMTIAGTGPRCPTCKKFKRQFIRQGHANTKYTAQAAHYLNPKPPQPLGGPLWVIYHVYMQTHRRVDDLNLYGSLDDLIVKEKIIKDDNSSVIRCRDGSFVDYDKENPRAEIYIFRREDPKCLIKKCLQSISFWVSTRRGTETQN